MTTLNRIQNPLADAAERFETGAQSARELADAALKAAKANEHLDAFVDLDEDVVRRLAETVDAGPADGQTRGRVAGVPIAISDTIVTDWGRSRAGSKMLGEYRSFFNAQVVDVLTQVGAVPFGKTNVSEMGLGHSTETSVFGPTRHPKHEGYLAGGAAGGAAAAVAAGIVPGALAVDTLGSLRQSAAHSGVVGLRPTYGATSRRGVMALGSSFDSVGVITQSVCDAAWLLAAIMGHDPWDGTSTRLPSEDVIMELKSGIRPLRVGIAPALMQLDMSEEVRAAVEASKAMLEANGATIVDVDLPLAADFCPTAFALLHAEASSNFSRYDGVRFGYRSERSDTIDDLYSFSRAEGFGEAVQECILLGTQLLSEECYRSHYVRAQQLRRRIADDYQAAFANCDVILGPVTPDTTPKLGAQPLDPIEAARLDRFTAGEALASLPAISLPVGSSKQGLPLAVQLSGAPNSEATLLRAAYALEQLWAADLAEKKS